MQYFGAHGASPVGGLRQSLTPSLPLLALQLAAAMPDAPIIPATHQIAVPFRDGIDLIRARYFSRDPACWPVFRDPAFAEIMGVRKKKKTARGRVAEYTDGEALLKQLRETDRV